MSQLSQSHAYLDLLPSERLKLRLLADREVVAENLGSRGDGDLKAVPVLFNLRDTLDVLALLDEVIGETWERQASSQARRQRERQADMQGVRERDRQTDREAERDRQTGNHRHY